MNAASIALLCSLAASSLAAQSVIEIDLPPQAAPMEIAIAKDGTLWYTSTDGHIGRRLPTGEVKQFEVPTPDSRPQGITIGPDGNIWFTEQHADRIGRMTPAGVFTEFVLPLGSAPASITATKTEIWFTEFSRGRIGRMSLTGTLDEFTIPTTNSQPVGLAVDATGDLWFAENNSNKLGRIDPLGQVTEYVLDGVRSQPGAVAIDPEGKIWFTEPQAAHVGVFDPKTKQMHEFETPSKYSGPSYIIVTPDGTVWFTEHYHPAIGMIAKGSSNVVEMPIKSESEVHLTGIAAEENGDIWATEYTVSRLTRITPAPKPKPARRRAAR